MIAAATSTASPMSRILASTGRVRPAPWTQAKWEVPSAYSRASSGAPANIPITTGTSGSRSWR